MANIKMEAEAFVKGIKRKKGEVVEVSAAEARQYVSNGSATDVSDKPKKRSTKAVKKAPLPYKEVGDKIIFNFKLSAKGTRKDDGKPFTQKPQIVDAKKRPMEDQQIWGDSILKIICEPYGWNMPIGIGCTLRLKVVQVVKLVTGKPQNDILSGLTEVEQQPTEVREDQQQGVNL